MHHVLDEPVTLPCAHSFCRDCVMGWMTSEAAAGRKAACPLCAKPLPAANALVLNVAAAAVIAANDGE